MRSDDWPHGLDDDLGALCERLYAGAELRDVIVACGAHDDHGRALDGTELLLEGCLSVSEVAYRVGFDDLSYFSKSFKAYFGMSPSVFQKEKR